MDIDQPIRPLGHKCERQQAHIARQRDIVCAMIARGGTHHHVELDARGALVAVREGGDAFGLGQRQPRRIGIVRGDQNDLIWQSADFAA